MGCMIAIAVTTVLLIEEKDANMVYYWNEERYHTARICTYHNLSITGIMECTYRTWKCVIGTNCLEHKTDTDYVYYDSINVIASFEWTDPTSQLASVFQNYKEAKGMNFAHIQPDFCKESNSSVYNFVNDLRERKFFKCYVNPDRLGFVYLDTYDFNHFLLLVLVCSGFCSTAHLCFCN